MDQKKYMRLIKQSPDCPDRKWEIIAQSPDHKGGVIALYKAKIAEKIKKILKKSKNFEKSACESYYGAYN